MLHASALLRRNAHTQGTAARTPPERENQAITSENTHRREHKMRERPLEPVPLPTPPKPEPSPPPEKKGGWW